MDHVVHTLAVAFECRPLRQGSHAQYIRMLEKRQPILRGEPLAGGDFVADGFQPRCHGGHLRNVAVKNCLHAILLYVDSLTELAIRYKEPGSKPVAGRNPSFFGSKVDKLARKDTNKCSWIASE